MVTTPLDDLIARLEAFEPTMDGLPLAVAVADYLGGAGSWFDSATILTSLDTVTALIEDRLPGWAWSVGNRTEGYQAFLMRGPKFTMHGGKAKTAPCALLAVTLRALEAKETT